jgi:hypothetical protein
MAKAKGPFGDSQIPSWLSGTRTDVPAKTPLIGLVNQTECTLYYS